MANTTISPNMSLPVPVVGVEIGPDYATDQNNCFNIIDAHDHSTGSGVQITPSGLNINSDLTFAGYSATHLLKASFSSQSAALTGTSFASVVGGNLYFNDGSGNQIPITSAGGVAGSPGNIGSLTSPAAATYSAGSKTFLWTADSGKAAAMDNGAVIIRETNAASAKGVTLASPSSLAADYQLTLPAALPASTQYMTSNLSGVLSFSSADTIAAAMTSTGANAIAASMSSTGANSVGSSMTSTGANVVAANRTRSTGTTVAAGGVAIADQGGSQSSTSAAFADVTNLSVTITTSGRPIQIALVPGSDGLNYSLIQVTPSASDNTELAMQFTRGGSAVTASLTSVNANGTRITYVPALMAVDVQVAGTYTYKVQMKRSSGSGSVALSYCRLMVYEL